ncbi:MAG: nucleotide sugar dehydrogenase [Chloroflexota bacterium]
MPERDATRRSIAVVGAGYVGLVSAVGLAARGHSIELIETDPTRLAALRRGEVPFTERGVQEALTVAIDSGALKILEHVSMTSSDIVLICVGTPIDDRGHADVRAVEAVLADVAALAQRPVVVVRSTMPVGTSQRLLRDGHVTDQARFFTVPEFLAQGSALADFANPTRVVIGRSAGPDPAAEAVLVEVFGALGGPLRLVTLEEAELIKNGANAFLALKISFANEMAGLAEQAGADVGPVLEGIGLDPRIGSTYLRPSFGFGGSCLPKELQTIATSGQERGLEMHVTSAAHLANLAHQERFAERIDAILGGVGGRRIGLLGLAFKAGTDDIRSSPAVRLADWLLAHGAEVHAYDPAAAGHASRALPALITHSTAVEALTGADVAVIATEWPEFRDLDWAAARAQMASPLVIDGRRLLDPSAMRELGFRYERVGTPTSEPIGVTVDSGTARSDGAGL